jgi:mannopine transport system permease protein
VSIPRKAANGALKLGPILLIGAGTCYIFIFLFVPMALASIAYFDAASYQHIFVTQLYRDILVRSLRVAVEVSVVSIILGYPVAYYLARLTSMRRETVVVLLLFPLFVSFLVRAYSWFYVLGDKGFVNYLLLSAGLIETPIRFLFTEGAIVLASVNWTLPFMILPIYSSVEKIDNNLIEMSKNLGADDISTFRAVTFPLSLPGVASGVLLTFIGAFGMYITPAILGGPQQSMIANLISILYLVMFDWRLGAAMTVILMAITLVIVYAYNKIVGLDKLLEAMG